MKKILSLFLIILSLLSLFSACGEYPDNAEAPEGTGEDIASSQTLSPEDDEPDKETTETVSDTGAVVITAQDTSQGDPPQVSPGEQTPPAAQSAPGETAQAPAQTPAQTAPEKAEKPAQSGKSKGELTGLSTYDKPALNVAFFGDCFTISAANMFGAFCFEGGSPVNTLGGGFGYNNSGMPRNTYSPYELFKFDGTEADSKITGMSKGIQRITSKDSPPLDYFILMTGRDAALVNPSVKGRSLTAALEIAELVKKQSAGGKIVLLVPPPFTGVLPNYFSEVKNLTVSKEEHKKMISDYAEEMKKAVGECTVVRADEAYSFFEDKYKSSGIDLYLSDGKTPSEAGSYYIAAVLYSSLFGKTAYGLEYAARLSDEECKTLQTAAHEFVFKSAPTSKAARTSPVQPVFEPDSRFKDQVFPKNFEYLKATALAYFERRSFVDYDHLASNGQSDPTNYRYFRRTVDGTGDPEEALPYKPLFLDCTSFIWALLKSAFDYELPENRSKSLTFNELGNDLVVFEHAAASSSHSPEAAVQKFLNTLMPGDVIAYSDPTNSRGHGCLYLGDGYLIQCSSSSRLGGGNADYNFKGKIDTHEDNGAVRLDKIDFMTSPLKSGYQFDPSLDMTIRIIRPHYAEFTPTENAKARAGAMSHILAYKETSAANGVTVNPGGTVDITVVIKNVGSSSKTVEVKDALPQGLTLASGNNNFSVTVAPGETKKTSYSLTLSPSAKPGEYISYKTTLAGGLALNDTPVAVGKTLTADEQKKLSDAAKSVADAADSFSLVKKAYSAAGIALPINSLNEVYGSVFLPAALDGYVKPNFSSPFYKAVAPGLFGGLKLMECDNTHRVKYVSAKNLCPGDIVYFAVSNDGKRGNDGCMLYIGNDTLLTVTDGAVKTISGSSACEEPLERIVGEYCFLILRPSLIS
ncbi:MAG: C40 family peptidase [Clostridia bacterium]|nr:C40 family peptidase [Clostridia bacterium]